MTWAHAHTASVLVEKKAISTDGGTIQGQLILVCLMCLLLTRRNSKRAANWAAMALQMGSKSVLNRPTGCMACCPFAQRQQKQGFAATVWLCRAACEWPCMCHQLNGQCCKNGLFHGLLLRSCHSWSIGLQGRAPDFRTSKERKQDNSAPASEPTRNSLALMQAVVISFARGLPGKPELSIDHVHIYFPAQIAQGHRAVQGAEARRSLQQRDTSTIWTLLPTRMLLWGL